MLMGTNHVQLPPIPSKTSSLVTKLDCKCCRAQIKILANYIDVLVVAYRCRLCLALYIRKLDEYSLQDSTSALYAVLGGGADDCSEESPAVQVAVQVMTQLGGWKIGKLFPVYFYKNYKLLTPEGSGSWWVEDANHMKIAVKGAQATCRACRSVRHENEYRDASGPLQTL